jgi:hypothetical protein
MPATKIPRKPAYVLLFDCAIIIIISGQGGHHFPITGQEINLAFHQFAVGLFGAVLDVMVQQLLRL